METSEGCIYRYYTTKRSESQQAFNIRLNFSSFGHINDFPLIKKKTLQRSNVFVDLMATVGTAVIAAAGVSAGMVLTVVMVVVVTFGFGGIV